VPLFASVNEGNKGPRIQQKFSGHRANGKSGNLGAADPNREYRFQHGRADRARAQLKQFCYWDVARTLPLPVPLALPSDSIRKNSVTNSTCYRNRGQSPGIGTVIADRASLVAKDETQTSDTEEVVSLVS
jgi:hypothetical protein